jgi:hypothetical protein
MFKLLTKLLNELKLDPIKENKDKVYELSINSETLITIYNKNPYIFLRSNISDMPETKKEDLLIYLMRANLLGQGTEGSKIGLSDNEKTLTLLQRMDYEVEYMQFKENIETFINYLNFYKQEVSKYKEKINTNIL